MAYFGKDYKFEREENYKEFVKSLGLSESESNDFLNYKPTLKLVKTGDSYTLFSITDDPNTSKEITFKSGVEFDENVKNSNARSTYNIVDNIVSQIKKLNNGTVFTYKWEFCGDTLVESITNNKWNGTARRYYKTKN